MQYFKESTLKIMDEITNRRIDIRKTIERAAEFEGEKGVAIFTEKCAPVSYDKFSPKKNYKFDFLSERFFKIMNRYYISNKGIFITLAKGYNKIVSDSPEDYSIKTLNDKYSFSAQGSHCIALRYGIKITEVDGIQKVEFGCMFGAVMCGYGGVWGFNTIDKWGNDFNYNSLNNPVNQVAIKMMFDEIVFED